MSANKIPVHPLDTFDEKYLREHPPTPDEEEAYRYFATHTPWEYWWRSGGILNEAEFVSWIRGEEIDRRSSFELELDRRVEESSTRLGLNRADALRLRNRLRRRLLDREEARLLGDEIKPEPTDKTGRRTPEHVVPPPIDPSSLGPNLTPWEAAAVLRCTIRSLRHQIDGAALPGAIVRRRGGKGSKLTIDRDALLDHVRSLPSARTNAWGLDIAKGREKHR